MLEKQIDQKILHEKLLIENHKNQLKDLEKKNVKKIV